MLLFKIQKHFVCILCDCIFVATYFIEHKSNKSKEQSQNLEYCILPKHLTVAFYHMLF